MTLIHVSASATRRTGTATTAVETLASPTVGGSTQTSLWRATMSAGQSGPRHVIDSEQIWTMLTGEATVSSETEQIDVVTGDTVIMPAGAVRTVVAVKDSEFLVCGNPRALATIPGSGAEPVSPPWVR